MILRLKDGDTFCLVNFAHVMCVSEVPSEESGYPTAKSEITLVGDIDFYVDSTVEEIARLLPFNGPKP